MDKADRRQVDALDESQASVEIAADGTMSTERKPAKTRTIVRRESEREFVVSRRVNAPAHLVFDAWVDPEKLKQWWVPKSSGVTVILCESDMRTGGRYRLEIGHPSSDRVVTVFGRYLDVVPNSRIVWTNDECGGDGALTTVTFEDQNGDTIMIIHDLYPSSKALQDAVASGTTNGWGEQFEQLDELLLAGASNRNRARLTK